MKKPNAVEASKAGKIVFTFEDGLPPITFNPGACAPEMRGAAEMHGWMAKIGDAAALSRKQPDGTVIKVTEQMRYDEVARMVGRFEGGGKDWNERGPGVAREVPAIRALAAARGITYDECIGQLAAEAARLAGGAGA